jgi:3-oxoacyl-[acyl-carrier-protein] synthase-3|tara:strand:- start:42098 stop:43156 length:1059 start_codon:yes stop_codon:yes gene_type:complete
MGFIDVEGIQIKGVSTVVPKQVVYNKNYELLTLSEREMLIKTTGIKQRRVANKSTTTSDLAIEAANHLFDKVDWKRTEIDLLVFVTQSRDYYLPSTAVISQHKLGLSTSCIAFDIGLGCSGYVYGLSIIASMLKSGNLEKAILLAGDVSTISCNYNDKSAYPLFGDAGSATFIEKTNKKNKWSFDLNSDGSGEDAIKITDGGTRNLPSEDSFILKQFEGGIQRNGFNLALNGIDIFNFSVTTVPKSIKNFLTIKETDIDSIDYFIMHQANLIMNETIRKKLKIDPEKIPYSLADYGNTSSASIPLTMALVESLKTNTSKLLLSGFGVGLSWGNALLENDAIPHLLINDYSHD